MNPLLIVAAAIVIAVVDWTAVWTHNGRVERFAKPAVMVLLIAAALASTESDEAVRWLLAAGLAFALIGDVLLLPQIDRFLEGLASFLVGHVLYVVGFVMYDVKPWPGAVGFVVAGLLLALIGPQILRGVSGSRLAVPVSLYIATITVMVAAAAATGSWWFGVGGFIFALSDALLGHDRFVTPRTDRRFGVHVLYHVGQAALVVGLHQAAT